MSQTGVILEGELVVGPRPAESDWGRLASLGVTAVLCLQEEHEAAPPPPELLGSTAWRRIPVADGHVDGGELDPRQLVRAVEQIQRWRAEGHTVYVHCYMGIGRAPTVCAAYLATEHGCGLTEALDRVRAARPAARPTAQQLTVLAQYVAWLRRKRDAEGQASATP